MTYGKFYNSYEDKFHKTIYFIVKDMIMAHNKLAEFGFAPNAIAINVYTDFFYDELPTSSFEMASTVVPLAPVALPYAPNVALKHFIPGVNANLPFYYNI